MTIRLFYFFALHVKNLQFCISVTQTEVLSQVEDDVNSKTSSPSDGELVSSEERSKSCETLSDYPGTPPTPGVTGDAEDENDDEDSTDDNDQNKKKNRTAFTPHQICELEKRFRVQKYLSASERGEFALSLKLTDTQVS